MWRVTPLQRTTIEAYIGILEDTLLAVLLPAFEARLRTRERQHPKLYWVDPGLVRAAKRQLGPAPPAIRRRSTVTGAVAPRK